MMCIFMCRKHLLQVQNGNMKKKTHNVNWLAMAVALMRGSEGSVCESGNKEPMHYVPIEIFKNVVILFAIPLTPWKLI